MRNQFFLGVSFFRIVILISCLKRSHINNESTLSDYSIFHAEFTFLKINNSSVVVHADHSTFPLNNTFIYIYCEITGRTSGFNCSGISISRFGGGGVLLITGSKAKAKRK